MCLPVNAMICFLGFFLIPEVLSWQPGPLAGTVGPRCSQLWDHQVSKWVNKCKQWLKRWNKSSVMLVCRHFVAWRKDGGLNGHSFPSISWASSRLGPSSDIQDQPAPRAHSAHPMLRVWISINKLGFWILQCILLYKQWFFFDGFSSQALRLAHKSRFTKDISITLNYGS